MSLQRPVIVVTGSTGKTTTREMIACILQTQWNIFKTKANGNDVWFTRQYAKQIDNSHQAIVLEYGMRFSGDITKCCQIIQPNIGIITNVGTAHLGNFGLNLLGVAAAKSELIAGMKHDGVLFLNADDENSALLNTTAFKGRIITVSMISPSDYQAIDISHNSEGIRFKLMLDNILQEFYIELLGKHNIYNALFAIATAHHLGFSASQIQVALAAFKKLPRRLNLLCLPNNNWLLDDSFNASPEAMKAALDVLTEVGVGKKIAILGGMLDQAGNSDSYEQIGRYLAYKKIDFLYTVGCEEVGDVAKLIGEAAINAGFPSQNVIFCSSQEDLFKNLVKKMPENTTFLVKGTLFYKVANFIKLLAYFSSNSAFNQLLRDSYNRRKTELEKIEDVY